MKLLVTARSTAITTNKVGYQFILMGLLVFIALPSYVTIEVDLGSNNLKVSLHCSRCLIVFNILSLD